MSSGFKTALMYCAALALIEGLAIYVMENYERVRVPEWVGYSGEARTNDHLAAQRFITAMGREAVTIDSLYTRASLPDVNGTIIVASERRFMSPLQHERLLAWAHAGGDLVVTLGDDVTKDPVLKAVDVRLLEPSADDAMALPNDFMFEPENWVTAVPGDDDETEGADEQVDWVKIEENAETNAEADEEETYDDDEGEYGAEDSQAPTVAENEGAYSDQLMHIPGTSELYKVGPMRCDIVSGDPGGWQVYGRDAACVVRAPYGEGLVTVIGTLYIAENQAIGDHDHAAYLWALLSSTGHTGPVWIVNGVDAPSLWSVITKRGWPALVAMVLTIVLALWRFIPRVGAPVAPLAPVRRELMEHVDATGQFLVMHAAGHVLIDSVQRHARARLLKRHPQVIALPERERRTRLAQLAKLSPVEVDALYRPQVGLSRNDFVAVQRILERISSGS